MSEESPAGEAVPRHPVLEKVTQRILERSRSRRTAYLSLCARIAERPRGVQRMGCANVPHALAAMQLLCAGLTYEDVGAVLGPGLKRFTVSPALNEAGELVWEPAGASRDRSVLRPAEHAFSPDGGLRVLAGNLGRAVVKVSAVKAEHRQVTAPAVVVSSQEELAARFARWELQRDLVAVVRGQGPRSNGMPELHKLTPLLGALQDQGFKVALLTDGRMSGASGKIPAAIHLSPDSAAAGPILRLREGDLIELDCDRGILSVRVDAAEWQLREAWVPAPSESDDSLGRGLFGLFREHAAPSEAGASALLS